MGLTRPPTEAAVSVALPRPQAADAAFVLPSTTV
jgi:hypothetical protein